VLLRSVAGSRGRQHRAAPSRTAPHCPGKLPIQGVPSGAAPSYFFLPPFFFFLAAFFLATERPP